MSAQDPLQVINLLQDIIDKLTKLSTDLEIIRRHNSRLAHMMKHWPPAFTLNRERSFIYYQQQSCQMMPNTIKVILELTLKDINQIMVEVLEQPCIETII